MNTSHAKENWIKQRCSQWTDDELQLVEEEDWNDDFKSVAKAAKRSSSMKRERAARRSRDRGS
jgi:hypothetical protein